MARMVIDDNLTLAPNFKVEDLTKSSTADAKGIDNSLPTEYQENATRFASALQILKDEVGGFSIDSGFRSTELNKAVGGSSTSRHLYAEAADIIPHTDMTKFFGKMMNNDFVKKQFGEISIKSNVIHLTLPYTNSVGEYVLASARKLVNGQYFRLTSDEISSYIDDYLKSIGAALEAVKEKGLEIFEDISDWWSDEDEEPSKPVEYLDDDDFVYQPVQHDMFDIKSGWLYDEFGSVKKPIIYGGIAAVGLIGVIILTRK